MSGGRRSGTSKQGPRGGKRPPSSRRGARATDSPAIRDLIDRARRVLGAGEYPTCITLVEEILSLSPRHAEALRIKGIALAESGFAAEGLAHLRQAVALSPDDALLRVTLARYLSTNHRTAEARAEGDRAMALWPDHPSVRLVAADLAKHAGDFEAALEHTQHALAIAPRDATVLGTYASVCLSLKRPGDAVDAIKKVLSQGAEVPIPTRARLLHELGAAYDKLKEFDQAFRCFERANNLFPEHEPRTVEEHLRKWDDLGIDRIQSLRDLGEGADSDLAVFVLGMPRSGTTLTERIVASHPEGGGVDESPVLDALWRKESESDATLEGIRRVARGYLAHLREPPNKGKRRVADKMPTNFRALPVIDRALPHASVVYCRRDPRDVCLSCFFQNFGGRMRWSRRLRTCAREYVVHDRLVRRYRQDARLRVLDWDYEDLVGDPEPHIRRLIDFVGLDFHPACLEPHKSKREATTASVVQVREPINKSGAARWKNYEKHLGPMLDILTPLLEERQPA